MKWVSTLLCAVLCASTALAEGEDLPQRLPADVAQSVPVENGRILTTDGLILEVDQGVFLNVPATMQVAAELRKSDAIAKELATLKAEANPSKLLVIVIGIVSLLVGGVAGVGAAKALSK